MNIILKKPLISEKSMKLAANGLYTFVVDKEARKPVIIKEVEKRFGVDVVSIKTVNFKGLKRQQRSRKGYFMVPEFKKALVQVKNGQKIALFEAEKGEKEVVKEKEAVKEKKSLLKGTKVKIERLDKTEKPQEKNKEAK